MEDLVKSVIDYFSETDIEIIPIDTGFEVSGYFEEQQYSFACKLEANFPYVMPTITLNQNAKVLLLGKPHRFVGDELCTYPRDVVFPNFYRPDRIVIESIEKAIAVITCKNSDEDLASFDDEFKDYWEGKINDTDIYNLFVEDLSDYKILYCYKYVSKYESKIFIAESVEKVVGIAKKSLCYDESNESTFQAILVPITSSCAARTAITRKDWYEVIKEHSNSINQYSTFLRINTANSALIIFTLYSNDHWIACGFKHSKLGDHPSFEKGRTPVPLVLAGPEGKQKIERIKIFDCSQIRLFTRGSIGQLLPFSNAAIIGCGSLGSHLVNELADCGLNQFSLFDYEHLSIDNIARHICGFFHTGKLKTNAMQFYLNLKNPNISCECFVDNIHNILQSSIELLNQCDVIFVTTADIPIDAHITSLLSQRQIHKPIIIMWLEPYAIAAHAIVLQKPQDIFDDLYDNQFNYKFTILKNASNYMKRDSGCQATYVQYSSLHVKMFVCNFLDYLFTNNIFSTISNYRFYWLGSFEIAQKFNLEINDTYLDKQWNKLYCENIDDD